MSDTPKHVRQRLTALYQARTPAERLHMATSMFTTAKGLVRAGLRREGVLGEVALRQALFLRLHAKSFGAAERDGIAQALANRCADPA